MGKGIYVMGCKMGKEGDRQNKKSCNELNVGQKMLNMHKI